MKGHSSVRSYLLVFGALMVMTVVTVLASYWHLPAIAAITLGLSIATVKAALVAAFFMHLKGERWIIYGLLGVTALFLVFLFVLPIADSLALSPQRQEIPTEAQAPGGVPHVP